MTVVALTGSSETAKKIQAGRGLNRLRFEGGGCNWSYVDDGYTPEELKRIAARLTYSVCGFGAHKCTSLHGIAASGKTIDALLGMIHEEMNGWRVADPREAKDDKVLSPLMVHKAQTLVDIVAQAKKTAGVTVVREGGRADGAYGEHSEAVKPVILKIRPESTVRVDWDGKGLTDVRLATTEFFMPILVGMELPTSSPTSASASSRTATTLATSLWTRDDRKLQLAHHAGRHAQGERRHRLGPWSGGVRGLGHRGIGQHGGRGNHRHLEHLHPAAERPAPGLLAAAAEDGAMHDSRAPARTSPSTSREGPPGTDRRAGRLRAPRRRAHGVLPEHQVPPPPRALLHGRLVLAVPDAGRRVAQPLHLPDPGAGRDAPAAAERLSQRSGGRVRQHRLALSARARPPLDVCRRPGGGQGHGQGGAASGGAGAPPRHAAALPHPPERLEVEATSSEVAPDLAAARALAVADVRPLVLEQEDRPADGWCSRLPRSTESRTPRRLPRGRRPPGHQRARPLRRRAGAGPGGGAARPGGPRILLIKSRAVLFALRGHASVLPFENNDIPGVSLRPGGERPPPPSPVPRWETPRRWWVGSQLVALQRALERGGRVPRWCSTCAPCSAAGPVRAGDPLGAHGRTWVQALPSALATVRRSGWIATRLVVSLRRGGDHLALGRRVVDGVRERREPAVAAHLGQQRRRHLGGGRRCSPRNGPAGDRRRAARR